MRTITHGDVAAAARAVLGLPEGARRAAADLLLSQAHSADLFRKRLGRAHPLWGNGSLMAAALCRAPQAGEPYLSDRTYLEAMATVIEAILAWRAQSR